MHVTFDSGSTMGHATMCDDQLSLGKIRVKGSVKTQESFTMSARVASLLRNLEGEAAEHC